MSSSSYSMDYQKKPIKVKSRWAQSSQMELMTMEESQSSLDMSDSITDVSTSDFNEISDYSSELNAIELRRSRRTHNRTDYRQLNGLKTSTKKKCLAFNSSNKKGQKRNQLLNTTDIDEDDKCKDNIMQDPNDIVMHPSENWKNIKIFQSKRRSKSVHNINEDIEKYPLKLIRRASLSWKFKFTNEVEDISNILNKCNRFNISNGINNLDLNDASLKVISSTCDDKQLCENDKLEYKDNTTIQNDSQLSHYSDINILNYEELVEKINRESNITEFDKISATNHNTETDKQCYEMNTHVNQCNEEKTYQFNNLVIHNSSLSELQNLSQFPNIQSREVRSKSLDSFMIKINCDFKRSKSYDDINKLKPLTVDTFKLQKVQTRSQKKKRRQSKRIKPKTNGIEILDDMKFPEVNYDKVADEIYKEHKNQLSEARNKDKKFDDILKSTNFTLVNENIYRPNRQTLKMSSSSEISALRKLKKRVISGDINDYCECTLSKEDIIVGNTGCDDRCLNRLLKVECGSGCSLKRYCTNKQFQNKQFQKTNIIKTEQKGYGICAVDDIPKGVLINEYVGEVIDFNEMCNRLRKIEYANLNYLVKLNSDEIIDSTSKGNLTRFINHSCDPNSVGEKWHVLGQSRIGFFSTRPIKRGEEITFDYSFQIFGDGAQICYCGSSKCRGYISKTALITNSNSNSEDSDDDAEDNHTSKSEKKHEKRTILNKRIVYNDENKLRELRRQLTGIAKLKTGLKPDQEMAILNLNRLMVHITDSASRLHVLKFIREHDMNKRLFMDFSGLSIIHNWMTSNENESFKLMILDILAELPITNRNTITKSKVLDVVAEWADISQDIKIKIESLEHPTTELQNHVQEIDNILPTNEDNESMNGLIEKARALWKKWIVLKMVFKIPKKIDQHKPIEEINLNKVHEDPFSSAMDISTLDPKPFRISNKYASKVRNQQTIPSDRMKLRKEYELKIEQERKNMFRKKVLDDWHKNVVEVMKNKPNQDFSHQQTLNFFNCDNPMFNHNNEIIKQPRWDCSPQVPHISQNPTVNYNMQMPCSNFMPPQVIQQPQFSQYSFTQPQVLPNYHLINQQTVFNMPPPPLPNQKLITRPLNSITLPNKPVHEIIENPDLSPSKHLFELAENNVFNLINESLRKHHDKNKNIDTETEHPNKMCSRTVQSGADMLARIKVISNSFNQQPSKLIKIKHFKQRNNKTKLKNIPLSDTMLKSVCNKNKRITFINEQNGVTSNTLSKDLVPLPKMIPLSGKNKFAHAIFTTLVKKARLQKEKLVPIKFVSKDINSDLITCVETDKEIELYKNMKPKIIKKIVSHIKVKNGLAAVMKRQWGMKLKGLKRSHEKIPATKRNIMRKGNIHKLALKNCLVNKTKSALKRKSSVNVDDYLKRPKEKRVTFCIEGETSPIFPNSTTLTKQKPLMKCHPFEIRNEPKSILMPSTSAVQDDNLQFPTIHEQSFDTSGDQMNKPIVTKFKASRSKHISYPHNKFEIDLLQSKRKNLIPKKLTRSLSFEVLKLFPDNKKEMKKVIDFHYAMVRVIVKTLGSYAKKTCLQGRIRNDEDFKFLAKKFNDNVLLKELQCKKVDKLKISSNTPVKVAEYINKYMSRFGVVYKKRPNEQPHHHNGT